MTLSSLLTVSPRSILVGAPNESGSNDTRRTGAVYQCELDSSDNNCSRIVPFDSYTGVAANTACEATSENVLEWTR